MKKLKILTALMALAVFACSAATNAPTVAPPATSTNAPSVFTRGFDNFTGLFKQQVTKDLATDFYKAGVLDLDLSATYTAAGGSDFGDLWTSKFKHGNWGVNVGSMFWISRYVGTGVDFGMTDINNPGSYMFNYGGVDTAVRYPIGRVAPYIIATAGRNFDAPTWYWGVGPGISFAITDRAKIFTDARFIWQNGCTTCTANGTDTTLVARMGLTISF